MSSILTVTQLNRYLSFKLKEDNKLKGLLIRGEISGFTNHTRTGHFYFTLKDGESAVKAVMFNSFASRLGFMPENGMNVIVMGSVQVFERDGLYQLYVTDIQPDGLGTQYLALEQLKERLSAEGLFDEGHKKPLPTCPGRVGIVTAKGGAALRDILNILGRRFPFCEAVLFPCTVQGAYSENSICEALLSAESSGCDVIICGRGGGSREDLYVFNSERIARTVYAMKTPVISAVGHETDTTLIDYVSDLRAPTPSAAAELAVPEQRTLREKTANCKAALDSAFEAVIAAKRHKLLMLGAELEKNIPAARLSAVRERLVALSGKLTGSMKIYLERKEKELSLKASELEKLSPLKVMARGYSLVYKDGELVKSADRLSSGDEVLIRLSDGEAKAVIE